MNISFPTRPATVLGALLLPWSALQAQTAPGSTGPEDEELIVLSPFEVSTARDTGYAATETLAGTRIRTNLADIGSAISVVTRELLNDIGATDNSTLLQYTPNAEVAGTRGTYAGLGNGTSVDETGNLRAPGGAQRVRGLSSADNTRDFFVTDIPWDSYNVDRVDIQRGPNSILFGLGKPAGIVNASTRNAEFRTRGEVQARIGSYGSWRTSLDYNQVVVDDTLAIRVSALRDEEQFQQEPAFENDERIYGALRWDPQLFSDRSARTSIKLKYEHGEIDANRPRLIPPNDHITPFFRPTTDPLGGVNRAILGNSYTANRETTPAVGGDDMGQLRSVDPDYNAWYAGMGNDQQPFYFMDGSSGQTYRIYGGFINNGARNADGSIRTNNSAILGRRYAGVFHTLTGLPGYASNARLPGYQYGQYREQSLTDPSIFDFYNTLIDGPTKSEWENWDAYNINLSQTAFDDRLGVELIYDRQKYDRGGQSALGFAPTLNIDVLGAFQDLGANPNVGRPFVQASGNGSSYRSDREYVRGSLFAELRTEDWTRSEFLQKLIGRQRFNGVYSGEEFYSEERRWNLYSTTPAFDTFTTVNVTFTDRPPLGVVYLGPAIHNNTSAVGANIPGIDAPIELNDGSMYHFSSEWTNFAVPFDAPFTPPNDIVFNAGDANAQVQAANPANYRGWNSDYYLDIARWQDGDESLTTGASKALRKVASYAGSWQSYLWNDALVGTFGWRYDHVRNRDVTARNNGPRSTLVLTPGVFDLPDTDNGEVKEHSTSWGAVLHLNKLFPEDRLPFNISLSYNESSNFEVSSARRNLYGDLIPNPTGSTEDYGILLSTKDNKYSLRVLKYEASVQNATTSGNFNNLLGGFVADGLRWRNVFLYDLNAYTLDTANGANEWRYNFDPDEPAGETQEQATARENAAIAAWNEIQAHMPAEFYQAWGFTPPADLANPQPSEVYSYTPATAPAGLTMTSDTISKGYEFEFIANPTPNWRIILNGSRTEASRSNVGSPETVEFINYLSEMMNGPAGELRQFSGGPTANTFRTNWNNAIGAWTLLRLQEGASASEIREWRYNVVTNYSFRDGVLKGFGIGGSYRWQDEVVIGYPVLATSATTYTFDLANPYYGPSEDSFDAWISYERKLTDKIHWKIQLNGRNLFGKEELIPISVQPDGRTWASARIAPNREWFLTNTFSF